MFIIPTNSNKTTVQFSFYDHVILMGQFSLLPMKNTFYSPVPLSAEFLLKKVQQLFMNTTTANILVFSIGWGDPS